MTDQGIGKAFNTLADNQAAQSGIRSNVFENNIDSEYEWIEPKSGIFATVFPSDNTYHPLYNHDYLEITQHLANTEKIKDTNKRADVKKKIKEVVVNSYYMGYMKGFYMSLIIVAVIIVLWLLFKSNYLLYAAGIGVVAAGYSYMQAEVYGVGEGTNYWSTYMSDLTARLQNNSLEKVERDYMEIRQKDADRIMMERISSQRPVAPSVGTSFTAGLLGAVIGSRL
jgi:hypothetical protein